MTSLRSPAFLAVTIVVFAVFDPRPACGDLSDLPQRQVLIETVSVELHREMQLGFNWLQPRDTLDSAQSDLAQNWVNSAQASTADAIGQIQADSGLASSSIGQTSLTFLADTLQLQDEILALLNADAKVGAMISPNILAINNQVAAIEVLKERPIVQDNLDGVLSKKESKAVGQFYQSAHIFQGHLLQYGVTTNPLLGLFEGGEGGKKREILARLDPQELENLKLQVKKGDFIWRGTQKQPSDASVVLSTDLPPEFTIIFPTMLAEKLSNTYQAPGCQEAHVFRAPGLIGSRECSSERPCRLSVP